VPYECYEGGEEEEHEEIIYTLGSEDLDISTEISDDSFLDYPGSLSLEIAAAEAAGGVHNFQAVQHCAAGVTSGAALGSCVSAVGLGSEGGSSCKPRSLLTLGLQKEQLQRGAAAATVAALRLQHGNSSSSATVAAWQQQ
jgi:hypothetical protein